MLTVIQQVEIGAIHFRAVAVARKARSVRKVVANTAKRLIFLGRRGRSPTLCGFIRCMAETASKPSRLSAQSLHSAVAVYRDFEGEGRPVVFPAVCDKGIPGDCRRKVPKMPTITPSGHIIEASCDRMQQRPERRLACFRAPGAAKRPSRQRASSHYPLGVRPARATQAYSWRAEGWVADHFLDTASVRGFSSSCSNQKAPILKKHTVSDNGNLWRRCGFSDSSCRLCAAVGSAMSAATAVPIAGTIPMPFGCKAAVYWRYVLLRSPDLGFSRDFSYTVRIPKW